jgi:hypothetical protein
VRGVPVRGNVSRVHRIDTARAPRNLHSVFQQRVHILALSQSIWDRHEKYMYKRFVLERLYGVLIYIYIQSEAKIN